MTIKIEIPEDNALAQLVFGKALVELAGYQLEDIEDGEPVDGDEIIQELLDEDEEEIVDDSENEEVLDKRPEVDEKGIPFNPTYCAEATKPFYGSGSNKGQWKKRRGVSQEEYDAWYGDALKNKANSLAEGGRYEGPIDATLAFTEQEPEEKTVVNTGELMGWISEQIVAGSFTQEDVNQAYADNNLQLSDMFIEHPEANVQLVFNSLNSKFGK